MTETRGPLDLAQRDGLPEGLALLLADHPREGWRAHPEFGPLTAFWLERHLGFRRLLQMLRDDGAARVAGDMDARTHAARLSRLGGTFLNGLHEHHTVEDHIYFPKLIRVEPRMERACDLLDGDHHQLHDEIEAMAARANAVLQGGEAGPLVEHLARMARFLDRHLTDEEEVIVPVILSVGERAIEDA